MAMKAILLFGPPGSGKGTLAKILAQAGDFEHLSSGDVFRALGPGSPVHAYLQKGELVPDELTIQICMEQVKGDKLVLLDGIPRTVKQAEILDQYVDVKQLVLLDVGDEDVLIKRLQGRAKIEGRADDAKTEVLHKRMEVYHQQTKDVLTHYPEELISHVNADQTKLEVLRDSLSAIIPLVT